MWSSLVFTMSGVCFCLELLQSECNVEGGGDMCCPGCSLTLFRPSHWVSLVSVKVGLGRERAPPCSSGSHSSLMYGPHQVMALDCYVFGIKPPCPFLFPVQMPKLCAPAGFELWEIN